MQILVTGHGAPPQAVGFDGLQQRLLFTRLSLSPSSAYVALQLNPGRPEVRPEKQRKMKRIVVAAVLPIACTWAARHESIILREGVGLSAAEADKACQIGVVHPEKVRLLAVDVIPPTNRLLRGIGAKLGFVSSQTIGMTLRYGILIQREHRGDRRLLVHELAHVSQYERFGGFRGFLYQYLQECINPGYPLGDLELEAKKAEESYY